MCTPTPQSPGPLFIPLSSFLSSPLLLSYPSKPHRALYYVGMKIFKKFDLCEVLNVDDSILASWLKVCRRLESSRLLVASQLIAVYMFKPDFTIL